MKNVILKYIKIENWRAQNMRVDFSENKTVIKGRNESGKSTIYNAFLWLLTGCDEYDRTNFRLFDDTIEQTKETSLPAIVEAVISIDDVEYKLKRTATIGWTRKRGKVEWERKGSDNYTFSIDDIERSATDYRSFIESQLLPIDKLKIAINIGYILSLDWKECRKIFESLVGGIKISDYKGDYSDILDDLNKYTIDEVKQRYRSRLNPINASIDSLPITIDTLKANMPDLSEIEEAEKSIEEKKKLISDIDNKISLSNESLKPLIKRRDEELKVINTLKSELSEAERKYSDKYIKELCELDSELIKTNRNNEEIARTNKRNKSEKEFLQKSIALKQGSIESLSKRKEELLHQCRDIKARKFNETKCPYCGQDFPEDMIDKSKREFNRINESEYNSVVSQGKYIASGIDSAKKELESMKKELESLGDEIPFLSTDEITKRINDFTANHIPFNETDECKSMKDKIDDILSKLTVIENVDHSGLLNMRNQLTQDIEELSKKIGVKYTFNKQQEKIEELQKELRSNVVEKARIEGLIDKVSEFEREKASIISDRVNGKFDYISVKMTDINKSGDMVDTCVVLDNKGVTYNVTNTASRMLCGIDIARTFCKFYGVNMPLFIDNGERINKENIPQLECQSVLLCVSEDKNLNIERL